MALDKSSKVDLRGKYKRNIKLSFIIALIFLIAAFKFSPEKSITEKIDKPDIDILFGFCNLFFE